MLDGAPSGWNGGWTGMSRVLKTVSGSSTRWPPLRRRQEDLLEFGAERHMGVARSLLVKGNETSSLFLSTKKLLVP